MPKLVQCAITAFAVITIFLISSLCASAQFSKDITEFYPISGLSHMHSTFSDGVLTIDILAQLAKAMGLDYVIMSDHADDVEATSHDKVVRAFSSRNAIESFLNFAGSRTKEHGIENYIETCRQASIKHDILVVPGLEVELGGDRDNVYDPSGDPNRIHMLIIGPMTAELFHELMECVSTHNRMDIVQDQIGAIAHRGNCAVVIAHPFASDPLRPGWYTFYKNHIDNVDAVECFNISDDKALEALGLTNRDPLQGAFKPVSAISGIDYHGISPTEIKNLERISILMPGEERSGSFDADCQLVADAICNHPILALNHTMDWNTIMQETNNSHIYLDGRLISTSGKTGITEDINRYPQAKLTYYNNGQFFLSGLSVSDLDAFRAEDTTRRLADVANATAPISEALSLTSDKIVDLITANRSRNNRPSGAPRSGGNPFGPSLRINTR